MDRQPPGSMRRVTRPAAHLGGWLAVAAGLALAGCSDPTGEPPAGVRPRLAPVTDQRTRADVPVSVDVRILEGASDGVTLSVLPSNQVLLPEDRIARSGGGSAWTLTLSPTPGLVGRTEVRVTAANAAGPSEPVTFALSVESVPRSGASFTWARRVEPVPRDSVRSFGIEVGAAGDVVAVASSGAEESGRVVVLRREAGSWTEAWTVRPPGFGFGVAIGLAPFTLAVRSSSTAELYTRQNEAATLWTVSGRVSSPADAIDLEGGRLVVTRSDAAEVHRLGAGLSLEVHALDPGPVGSADDFGASAALYGDVAVVGAPGFGATGAAFVFRHDGSGWPLEQTLTPAGGAPGDRFGTAVAVEGDRIVVGAPAAEANGPRSGAVLVFERDVSGWTEVATLAEGDAEDAFGTAVDVSGGELVVGAPGATDAAGRAIAYHFVGSGAAWTARVLAAEGSGPGDLLGWAVSFDADVIVVGAPSDDAPSPSTGSAHLFVR